MVRIIEGNPVGIRETVELLIYGKRHPDSRTHTLRDRLRILRGKDPISDVGHRIVSRVYQRKDLAEVGLIPENPEQYPEQLLEWTDTIFNTVFGGRKDEEPVRVLQGLFQGAMEGKQFDDLMEEAIRWHQFKPKRVDGLHYDSEGLFYFLQYLLYARYTELEQAGQLRADLQSRMPLMGALLISPKIVTATRDSGAGR